MNEIRERKQAETRLRHTQKTEAIGTLAGGIAHDFNNILTAILGFANLVQDELSKNSELWAEQHEVIKAANRAKELVKQILAVSRQTEHGREPIQVHLIIKEALQLLRPSIPATIEIHSDIDPASGYVMADPTQIYQIIMNLCTNASHAMQERGGELHISLSPMELNEEQKRLHEIGPDLPAGKYLKLVVRDTGIGIAPDVLDKIFDPYFTTKRKGEGTGLGLAVVQGIVKTYGGDITVASNLGQGSTFTVFLPRIEIDMNKKPEEDEDSSFPEGNERILVVDDEEPVAGVIDRLLTSLGYQVTIRTKSPEALQLLQNQPDQFDLVITDMTMPGMTGDELAEKLLELRQDLPIILCTGFHALIDEKRAKAIGIREFIFKPFSKGTIAETVRRALDSTGK